jgi:uncharacterized membrane protein
MERLASVIGGGALAAYGLRRRGASGLALAALGAAVARRGVTGHCPVYQRLHVSTAHRYPGVEQRHGPNAVLDAHRAIRVERSVIIDRPRQELYDFWRDFENLPRVMRHLESVRVLDARLSHWKAAAPAGTSVQWEAEIYNEIPGELIAWRAFDTVVPNAGSVRFNDAPGGRGTEVHVVLEYDPPAGKLGALVARLFGESPDVQVREDLLRFKQVMEGAGASSSPIPPDEGA